MDRRYKKRIARYWKKMQEDSDRAFSRLDPNEWFDLWHTHPDWDGKGNKHLENRVSAYAFTFELLQRAEKLMVHRGVEAQCWAIFSEDTADNAVYIHTGNPNGSGFPFKYDGVTWNAPNEILASLIDINIYEMGIFRGEVSGSYFVRKRT